MVADASQRSRDSALAMQLLDFALSGVTDESPWCQYLWLCVGGTAVTSAGPAAPAGPDYGRLSGLVLRRGALANINIRLY